MQLRVPSLLLTAAFTSATFVVSQAQEYANCRYRLLNAPGAYATQLSSINNHGDILGIWTGTQSSDVPASFVWRNGSYVQVNVPGSRWTVAGRINNRGDVIGSYLTASGTAQLGFLFTGGKYKTLNPGAGTYSLGIDINDQGDILGYANSQYYVLRDGKITYLNFDPNVVTYATAINNAGWIVGYYGVYSGDNWYWNGFLLKDGQYTTISFPGSSETLITDVNNNGVVLGYWANDNMQVGNFAWQNGSFKSIPGTSYLPIAINDYGWMVGYTDYPLKPSSGIVGSCH